MLFKKTLLSLVLASVAAVANAGIEVATFDELSVDLNNYYGATWTGNVFQSTDFAVSGESFLYANDHKIWITFAAPITFIGAYYASWGGAGTYEGGGHSFELFNGSGLVFQGPMDQPTSNGLDWVASNYAGTVTSVVFYGGSEGPAIDNFTFSTTPTTAVPEPESYAMLLAGLGLMGAAVRRRKSKKI